MARLALPSDPSLCRFFSPSPSLLLHPRSLPSRSRLPCPPPLSLAASQSSSSSSSPAAPKSARGSGLKKLVVISPALQQFLGAPQASRADTMKQVWDYIKSHNLQSESDKRLIVCDEKLKDLLGKDRVNFLEIAKLLSPHFPKSS